MVFSRSSSSAFDGGATRRNSSWVRYALKRVFKLDLETCEGCGGQVRVVACIEDPLVIARILGHLDRPAGPPGGRPPVGARGPPSAGLESG
ncbi:MAG: hypothetical protein OEW88_07050 [Gammaproteobacteria bacterium]|nr:hypothetical protein [Gammaproteobacteria bacterium]